MTCIPDSDTHCPVVYLSAIAPNPPPPSQQGMNRASEEAIRVNWQQQQQQLHESRSGGGGAPNPRDSGGSSTNMPPYQQERMMGPDLRYMQDMRRNEEIIMAANRGVTMSGDFAPSFAERNARYQEGHSLSPDGHASVPYGGGSGNLVARRGLVMPPHAQGNNSNPYMLLSLLQSEQQRLMQVNSTIQAPPESWLPTPKRPRLPPHAGMAGMEPAWIPQQQQGMQFSSVRPEPKQRKRHVKSFPQKLMETINEYYDESIIAWLPDGKSFVVVDPDLFVENVLSQTFKGGKYSSFVRKLNRWGFSRLISGTGMDCFHNPLFQRDRPELCGLITSNPERNDTVGVDPNLLGGKPSLAGIEKYFELKGKEPPKVSNNRAETTHTQEEEQDDDDDEEDDDQKPAAAAEEPESSNAGQPESPNPDDGAEAANVEIV